MEAVRLPLEAVTPVRKDVYLDNLGVAVLQLPRSSKGAIMAMKEIDLLQGTLDLLVLKTLSAGPMHGYRIASKIQQLSADVLRVEEGSLYPALYRLEQKGLIKSEWGLTDTARRARFYRLTRKGRREIQKETESWIRLSTAVARVLKALEEGA